jgi:hypothetical protein
MNIKDVLKNAKDMTSYQLEQKLDHLVRTSSNFSNLNEANKDLVLDLIKEYKDHLRRGIGVSALKVREEMYHLYQNRLKLKLTKNDLDDIREILNAFRI